MTVLVPGQSVLVSSGNALDLSSNVDVIVSQDIWLISTDANGGRGIVAAGANNVTLNGNVAGVIAGVEMQGSGNLSIGQTGQVYGTDYAIYLGVGNKVINSGTLSGSTAIKSFGDTAVVNNGVLTGFYAGIYLSSQGTNSLTNNGMLSGGAYSYVSDSTSRDVVVNSGTISGDIDLGAGNDVFDGRKGKLNGYVYGGDGNDVIYNGKDGGEIRGASGHDTLYANTGNDLFVYESHAAADYDTIHGFDVKHDRLQLNHFGFDGLVAGKAVAFAVSTKATTPTDYLFYNKTTGYLYYDADGSGTADKPELVARMDKALALTAADFRVV